MRNLFFGSISVSVGLLILGCTSLAEPELNHVAPRPLNDHEWIVIPAGTFIMGGSAPNSENSFQEPEHELSIESFSISKHETTNAQYKQFLDEGNSQHRPGYGLDEYSCQVWDADGNFDKRFANYPVACITWDDAVAYTRWLSAKTGQQISLPSEPQWEKAARGEGGNFYPWGNKFDWSRLNGCDSSCDPDAADHNGYSDTFEKSAPVGSFPTGASPYGVEDMVGNVSEWTLSLKMPYPYSNGDEREAIGENGEITVRILRGGGYDIQSGHLYQSASRNAATTNHWHASLGFRVVLLDGE